MTNLLETLGLLALGGALVWVASLAATFWRENAPVDEPVPEKPPRRLWRGTLTITHQHTHALTPEVFAFLGETIDRAVADYFTRQREHLEHVPAARTLTTPPEPEERLARDLSRAHAVLRGADQLRAEAKARGMDLPHNLAMQEAARMVSTAFDDPL